MDQMQVQQTYLYWVNLPQFILNFKFKVVNFILPHLLELKRYLNDQENSQVVNPAVVAITFIVLLIVLKNIWNLLFQKRITTVQTTESKELNNEVNDLKKQLKSLKTSFYQLTKQLNTKQISSQSQIHQQKPQAIKQTPASDQTLNNLLNLYTISLDQNKSLINYVLESQCQVLKQLKKFKKLNKNSISSSGRPSMSTVRSKTTQKKLQRREKSPTKAITPLLKTQIKKTELKSYQKQVPKQQIPVNKQLKQQIPIKRVQEDAPNIIDEKQYPKQQVKPSIKLPVKVHKAPQKPNVPPVPNRQVNSKVEKSVTIKQQTTQSQQITMPVTMAYENPLTQNETKVEVQTIIKQTQFTEVVQTNNQVQSTKVEQFSSTETKIQTIRQNASLIEQNTQQNVELTTKSQEVEQIIIVAPQKPPQLKKGLAPPGMKPGMKRTPPPPPTRK